jgi:tetratricopeptide (TPR) repeat protein
MLYTNIGVTLPAEQAYLKAIDSIESPEDLEEWTLTALSLGELYELAQNSKQAIGWYQQARAGFIFLSDKSAETVTNRIEKLKNI